MTHPSIPRICSVGHAGMGTGVHAAEIGRRFEARNGWRQGALVLFHDLLPRQASSFRPDPHHARLRAHAAATT